MRYWNGYENFEDWANAVQYYKICQHCKSEFIPKSGNQKTCSRENNPECDDDKHFKNLWINGKHPLQIHEKNKHKHKNNESNKKENILPKDWAV